MAGRDNYQIEPHILFVDDNSDICELARAVLETAGFHVSTADSAPRALRLIAQERFDVLVLDNWMPDSTGIELCYRIRGFDKSTPILICSGAVTEADKKDALLAGAQGYVKKPFSSNDLIQALRSLKSAR